MNKRRPFTYTLEMKQECGWNDQQRQRKLHQKLSRKQYQPSKWSRRKLVGMEEKIEKIHQLYVCIIYVHKYIYIYAHMKI